MIINTKKGGTTPTGSLSITANGTYDVTNYASADVEVSGSGSEADTYLEYQGTTTYIHAEDWLNDTLGGSINFRNTYLPLVADQNTLYFINCEGNTAYQSYRFSGGWCFRNNYTTKTDYAGETWRNDYSNSGTGAGWNTTGASKSLWISAGTVITIVKFKFVEKGAVVE